MTARLALYDGGSGWAFKSRPAPGQHTHISVQYFSFRFIYISFHLHFVSFTFRFIYISFHFHVVSCFIVICFHCNFLHRRSH
jgi:hypothetical protein